MALIKLTQKRGRNQTAPFDELPYKPVWINPTGVNSVEPCAEGGGCWVRMDDGSGYLIVEDPKRVVLAVDSVLDREVQDAGAG